MSSQLADFEFPIPTKLLDCIVDLRGDHIYIALCPDFANRKWRYKKLSDHLFDWLPDTALKPAERKAMIGEPRKTLATACRRTFDVSDPNKRGELGEILLHAICRQEYRTAPLVARLFYKMRTNDSVTSVDMVHALQNPETGGIELWLGEAKIYSSVSDAKRAALRSIEPLWDPEFLEEMKALVGPKIESSNPYASKLEWLFADETSLDQLVSRIVVPICVAADFPPTMLATYRGANYLESVRAELEAFETYFTKKVPQSVRFVLIFVPLNSKSKLEVSFNTLLKNLL